MLPASRRTSPLTPTRCPWASWCSAQLPPAPSTSAPWAGWCC